MSESRSGSAELYSAPRNAPMTTRYRWMFPAALLLCSACAPAAPAPPIYDVLITGGAVLDGTGAPAVKADVGIRDGRIADIGDLKTATAKRRIDATGLTVAPGFIDMHNHSDYTI